MLGPGTPYAVGEPKKEKNYGTRARIRGFGVQALDVGTGDTWVAARIVFSKLVPRSTDILGKTVFHG